MSLRAARIRKPTSITSLIDVIFLLLLFFMLASTFTKHAEFDISATTSAGDGEASDDDAFRLHITASTYQLNDVDMPLDKLLTQLSRTMPDTSPIVRISLADDVITQRLTDTLLAIKDVPAIQISLEHPA